MVKLPMMPWYPADFKVDSKVRQLPPKCRMIYREILDEMWLSDWHYELPDDPKYIANLLNLNPNSVKITLDLLKKFSILVKNENNLVKSIRLEKEYNQAVHLYNQRCRAGLSSAQKRKEFREQSTTVERPSVRAFNKSPSPSPSPSPLPSEEDIPPSPPLKGGMAQSDSETASEIALPLNDSSEFFVPVKFISEMEKAYPAVNVIEQLSKMRAWLIANKKNRKTKRGITRFINTWLAREQDKPRRNGERIDTLPDLTGIGERGLG